MAYDLKAVEMPRIHGKVLRALAELVEAPGVGHAIRARMLRNLGFPEFRLAKTEAAPAPGPVLPTSQASPAVSVTPESLADVAGSQVEAAGYVFETVQDFREAYAQGKTTPSEVAQRFLDNLGESERHSPALRLFIETHGEDLLRQAEASTRRHAEGHPLSVLDGVPVPVKDEIDVEGYPTTVGTQFLGTTAAKSDATSVARLRAAGALLPGKTNMHELGIGVTSINPYHGAVRNPYDPACITGGSSGGSAAAVAAGLGPVALGADGGGSVRIPAGLCGVVGLKPTFGRVSEHGAAPLCWSLAHIGPLAASARDAAVVYAIMAGADRHDPHSLAQPDVDLGGFGAGDLKGYRFGVYRPWFEDADPKIVATCERALKGLVERGASIEDIEIEGMDIIRVSHLVTIVAEMVASQLPNLDHRRAYGLDTRMNFALGRVLSASYYVHAQRHRTDLCAQMASLLERVDGIVTPTTACVAEPIADGALESGESNLTLLSRLMRYAPLANLTGLPAITFPAGYDDRGMPIGLQVMGRAWEEHRLLQIAHVAESLVERRAPRWHRRLLG